jgi:glycosyltransferase involved in cell wall biosynthesis
LDNPFSQSKSEIKFMEAALLGIPTVASPTQAFQHAIISGENGYLAAPGDWQGLAREILFFLRNPTAARRCAERGRQLVAERFGVKRMVQATEEVYRRLLARG